MGRVDSSVNNKSDCFLLSGMSSVVASLGRCAVEV